MPISRREFEKGELDPSLLVEQFLRSNPDCAYTLQELMSELASKYTLQELMSGMISKGAQFSEDDLGSILERLSERGRIESKTIGGVLYYCSRGAIGFEATLGG
jgi:hypothetical protein